MIQSAVGRDTTTVWVRGEQQRWLIKLMDYIQPNVNASLNI